ncbi:MAG: FecR domain-containing protein [Niabella sp.]
MERLEILFKGYLDNNLSEAEYAEFWQLLEQEGRLEQLSPELQRLWESKPTYSLPAAAWNRKLKALQAGRSPKTGKIVFWRYAAAVLLLFIAGGAYLLLSRRQHTHTAATVQAPVLKNDIAPGTNGAILSFSNGKTIVLDTAHNGRLMEGVIKTDGHITVQGAAVEYATLTTPRAKQQQLVLDDGTRVWLNAASSIRFPSAFTGNKREVEVTGEAYFEVAHDKNRPFFVTFHSPGREGVVEVLGTHFNINAYANEADAKVTLLEGSVKVKSAAGGQRSEVTIRPGQQVVQTSDPGLRTVNGVDIDQVIAWKNGQQLFKKATIAGIMRQVERWYDVDVVYQTMVPANITFSGDLPRDVNLSALLKVFERPGVHFVIDAAKRKVTVTE